MKKPHSLPLTPAQRLKRREDALEHERLALVHGDVKITRNDENYITKVEKVAEDVVVEETIKRDTDNYITGTETRIRIKKGF